MIVEKDVLREPFTGWLQVTIQDVGTRRIQCVGEPICMILANVALTFEGEGAGSVIVYIGTDIPYQLVSFDREKAEIVVRKRL